jgi:hypothetical protein
MLVLLVCRPGKLIVVRLLSDTSAVGTLHNGSKMIHFVSDLNVWYRDVR